jgi:hypothetical protein
LRLACEGVFQALFRARAFECCHVYLLVKKCFDRYVKGPYTIAKIN